MFLQVVHQADVLDSISKSVQRIAEFILPYALTASMVGALSMALLQTIKDMFPVRDWFQHYKLQKWFKAKKNDIANFLSRADKNSFMQFIQARGVSEEMITEYSNTLQFIMEKAGKLDFHAFEKELLSLSTDGNKSAFYNLPIEQLCGQLNTSAQIAIEYPARYSDLLLPFVVSADEEDALLILASSSLLAPPFTLIDKNAQNLYTDARNRVAHQIQRAIDAIQISFGDSWKKTLQLASFLLSGIICAIGVGYIDGNMRLDHRFEIALVSAIIGGFLAPVARDLVAALQKLRA